MVRINPRPVCLIVSLETNMSFICQSLLFLFYFKKKKIKEGKKLTDQITGKPFKVFLCVCVCVLQTSMKHSKTCYFVPLIVNTEKTCVCNIDKYEAFKNLLLFSSNCKHGETLLLSSTLLKDDEVVEDLSFVGWVLGA